MFTKSILMGLCFAGISVVLGCEKQVSQEAATKAAESSPSKIAEPTTPAAKTAAPVTQAEAVLSPTEGSTANGRVYFRSTDGGVEVRVEIAGLQPNSEHGFHIHEKGDCSATDGTSAGGHYAPHGNPHGLPPDPKRHAGDMGNVVADDTGRVSRTETFDTFSLDGTDSVVGRAVILHAERDTGAQPTGAAGARLACGVINALK